MRCLLFTSQIMEGEEGATQSLQIDGLDRFFFLIQTRERRKKRITHIIDGHRVLVVGENRQQL